MDVVVSVIVEICNFNSRLVISYKPLEFRLFNPNIVLDVSGHAFQIQRVDPGLLPVPIGNRNTCTYQFFNSPSSFWQKLKILNSILACINLPTITSPGFMKRDKLSLNLDL